MGSSFKVAVQTPSFQGAFTALTEHVRSLLTCAAWPHSGWLAPHLGERVGQSTRAGAWVSMGGWRPP